MKEMNEEMKKFVDSIPVEEMHCFGYACKTGNCPIYLEEPYEIGGEESSCAACIIRNMRHELKDRMNSTRKYRVSVLVNARNNADAVDMAKWYFDAKNVRVDVVE